MKNNKFVTVTGACMFLLLMMIIFNVGGTKMTYSATEMVCPTSGWVEVGSGKCCPAGSSLARNDQTRCCPSGYLYYYNAPGGGIIAGCYKYSNESIVSRECVNEDLTLKSGCRGGSAVDAELLTEPEIAQTCPHGIVKNNNCECDSGYYSSPGIDQATGMNICCPNGTTWNDDTKECEEGSSNPSPEEPTTGYCYKCKTPSGNIVAQAWSATAVNSQVGNVCGADRDGTWAEPTRTTEANCPNSIVETCPHGIVKNNNCECDSGYYSSPGIDQATGMNICCPNGTTWNDDTKECEEGSSNPSPEEPTTGYCYKCKTSSGELVTQIWSATENEVVADALCGAVGATATDFTRTTEANCKKNVTEPTTGYCYQCYSRSNGKLIAQRWSPTILSGMGVLCGVDQSGAWREPIKKIEKECPTIACEAGYSYNTSTMKCEKDSSGGGTTPTPSTPGNPGNQNPSNNPQTGNIMFFIVWVIGLGAIGYTYWYFKQLRRNGA